MTPAPTMLIAAALVVAAALYFLSRAHTKLTVARYETFRARSTRAPKLVITARPTEMTARPTEISTARPFTPGITGRELALADGTAPGPDDRSTALSHMLASFP
jgi:hypothetical protein